MIELWHTLLLEPGPRPALVLDASDSATKLSSYLRSLAEGVLEAMPEASRPNIFFLGNPQPFDPRQFPAHGEKWFEQNAKRGSFMAPIFDHLADTPDTTVAVAGAGRIFDLADWRGRPLADNAIWCKIGPVGLTDGEYPEETYTCDQLAERLNNPAVRVEVSGDGVMPFFWDDPSFKWENGKLVGTKTLGTVRIGTLSPQPDAVRVEVVQSDNRRRTLALAPAEPPPGSVWLKLPTSEFNLINQCRKAGRYPCPVCHAEHPFGQFRCTRPDARPILPTLDALPRGGFCIIDTNAWETKYHYHPCSALRLSPDVVAVRTADGGAELFRYDERTNSWKCGGERMKPLHPMGHKIDAMVV